MKFLSDCSGECEDCIVHYVGCCMAGHGDDDFSPVTKERLLELKENHLEQIKACKEKLQDKNLYRQIPYDEHEPVHLFDSLAELYQRDIDRSESLIEEIDDKLKQLENS